MYALHPPQAEILEQTLQGVVEQEISGQRAGRVKVMGVSWMARPCRADMDYVLKPGTSVIVYGRCGNTLLIGPCA